MILTGNSIKMLSFDLIVVTWSESNKNCDYMRISMYIDGSEVNFNENTCQKGMNRRLYFDGLDVSRQNSATFYKNYSIFRTWSCFLWIQATLTTSLTPKLGQTKDNSIIVLTHIISISSPHRPLSWDIILNPPTTPLSFLEYHNTFNPHLLLSHSRTRGPKLPTIAFFFPIVSNVSRLASWRWATNEGWWYMKFSAQFSRRVRRRNQLWRLRY